MIFIYLCIFIHFLCHHREEAQQFVMKFNRDRDRDGSAREESLLELGKGTRVIHNWVLVATGKKVKARSTNPVMLTKPFERHLHIVLYCMLAGSLYKIFRVIILPVTTATRW